jgi:hypothetical protein
VPQPVPTAAKDVVVGVTHRCNLVYTSGSLKGSVIPVDSSGSTPGPCRQVLVDGVNPRTAPSTGDQFWVSDLYIDVVARTMPGSTYKLTLSAPHAVVNVGDPWPP